MQDIITRLREASALPTGLYSEAADEIERLKRELATERRRVELLKQHGERQREIAYSLNKRLIKYEPGSRMILNDMPNAIKITGG